MFDTDRTPSPAATLGVLLISGGGERAHYAFVIATAAAAIGRDVTLFATNDGCHALLAVLPYAGPAAPGVATLAELRDAAAELGVRRMVCVAGLRMAGLTADALAPGVVVAGVPSFLTVAPGQVITI